MLRNFRTAFGFVSLVVMVLLLASSGYQVIAIDQELTGVGSVGTDSDPVTVVVDSKSSSGSTGMTVYPGESLKFKATGKWTLGSNEDGKNRTCDANGLEEFKDPPNGIFYGTLIGRIGDGSWFEIGTSKEYVVKGKGGVLELKCNDNKYDDNSGSITVTIEQK